MSLNKAFFERETNISARVVADSISPTGQRIVTIEAEYPRFILAEVNTHKALEKNSASSRAIPIMKMIEQIQSNMAVPLYWGKTKAGMQADGEVDCKEEVEITWRHTAELASQSVESLASMELHKQTANRLLEPFQMMKTVMTGTDWDNFFNLRIHPDAQPEFCMLAYKIYKAIEASSPTPLLAGQWHLPYVSSSHLLSPEGEIVFNSLEYFIGEIGTDTYKVLTLEEAQRISASCCAQTSYRKSDDSLEKADKVFEMLVGADVLHASPFGHLATPVSAGKVVAHSIVKGAVDYGDSVNITIPSTWEEGVTHMNRDGTLCSGNLTGWISYRHKMPNNTCYEFDFEKRMELFNG